MVVLQEKKWKLSMIFQSGAQRSPDRHNNTTILQTNGSSEINTHKYSAWHNKKDTGGSKRGGNNWLECVLTQAALLSWTDGSRPRNESQEDLTGLRTICSQAETGYNHNSGTLVNKHTAMLTVIFHLSQITQNSLWTNSRTSCTYCTRGHSCGLSCQVS